MKYAPAPAATPGWEPERAPGVFDGQYLGSIGTGGAALAVTILLLLATAPKAKHKVGSTGALVGGFTAASFFAGAGGTWAIFPDLIVQILVTAGVGSGEGPAGNVGMGAIAVVATGVAYFVDLKPRTSVYAGFALGVIYAAAGGYWALAPAMVSQFTGGVA